MAITITALPAKITRSGIRTKTVINANGELAFVEIYAKPCSPFTFELTAKTYEGHIWKLNIKDSLPVKLGYDPENIFDVSALASYIIANGHMVR